VNGDRPDVVAVVGATAVGKTALAVQLAEALSGEVVSLDSRQIYRGLDIGTAKPTADERRGIPHHLIDITTPNRLLPLSEVQALAYGVVEAIVARGRLPILAGGSGQYARAVLEGWVIPDVPPDEALRRRLERAAGRAGPLALHARLEAVDPASAARIDPRNVRRTIRALEIYERTGEPMSALRTRSAPPYDVLTIGLSRPRAVLYDRVDRRIEAMLAAGLEAEVRGLVGAGYGFELPAMSGVGYGEWKPYLDGQATLEEVVQAIRRNTRRLVRNQATWFRADDPSIRWFDLETAAPDEVVAHVRGWLARSRAG
jgi:tRNA dimethylallyltransferase